MGVGVAWVPLPEGQGLGEVQLSLPGRTGVGLGAQPFGGFDKGG